MAAWSSAKALVYIIIFSFTITCCTCDSHWGDCSIHFNCVVIRHSWENWEGKSTLVRAAQEWLRTWTQRANKVVSNSPGLVDVAIIGLVNSVLNLPEGQVKLFGKFKLQKNCNQCRSPKILLGYLKDSWASTHQQQLAQMASRTCKTDFLCTLWTTRIQKHTKHTAPRMTSLPCMLIL